MGGDASLRAPSFYPTLVERPVGQRITGIYLDRLRQFTDTGQYSGQNLVSYGYSRPVLFFLRISHPVGDRCGSPPVAIEVII
jgi:hypothetical protein